MPEIKKEWRASPNDVREWDAWAGSYGSDADLPAVLHDDELLDTVDFKGKRVLDLGGGTGRFARRLAAVAASVTVADYSAGMLEKAAENLKGFPNVNVKFLDFEKEAGGRGEYDIVLAISVLHHIAGLETAVKNMKSFLAPGGKILIVEHLHTRNPVRMLEFYLAALLKLGPLACAGFFWNVVRGKSLIAVHMKSETKMTLEDFRGRYSGLFPGAAVRVRAGIFAILEWAPGKRN